MNEIGKYYSGPETTILLFDCKNNAIINNSLSQMIELLDEVYNMIDSD